MGGRLSGKIVAIGNVAKTEVTAMNNMITPPNQKAQSRVMRVGRILRMVVLGTIRRVRDTLGGSNRQSQD